MVGAHPPIHLDLYDSFYDLPDRIRQECIPPREPQLRLTEQDMLRHREHLR